MAWGKGRPRILGSFKIRRGYGWTFSSLPSLFHAPFQETPLVQQTPLLKLLVDYLPSIFISVFNFVLPPVFKFIASLEGYTRSRQIVLILLRFWTHGMGWECREKRGKDRRRKALQIRQRSKLMRCLRG